MKFDLKCFLQLSSSIEKKDFGTVERLLKEAAPLLQKGVPKDKEGCRIAEHKVSEDGVFLRLISERYVRPHDAIFRIINHISPLLGKELKVGIRDIKVEDYQIEYELEGEPKTKVTLPFAEKIEIKNNIAHLTLKDIDREALENKYIDRLLKRLEEKIRQEEAKGKAEYSRVIKESEPRVGKYKVNAEPTDELEKRNFVAHAGKGVWIILPPYAALWRAIEQLVFDKIAKPLGFKEVALPKIINLDIEKKKGQLYGIPNEMWWVCAPATREQKEWEDYIDLVKITGKPNEDVLMKHLSPPEFALSYAQCEPFYEIWSRRVVDVEKMPIKLIDNYGPTWRYESGGLKGLERLSEFKRMEFTWIGAPEDVVKIRDEIRDKAVDIIDKIFDVEWKLEATTAVYLEHAGEKVEKEDREYVRTYDLSAALPFETPSKKEKALEISSFHVHEDHYAKNFYWKEKKGRTLWSGCTGISPTRWAYVFILRYGFDYDSWHPEIKKYIGKELPGFPEGTFL